MAVLRLFAFHETKSEPGKIEQPDHLVSAALAPQFLQIVRRDESVMHEEILFVLSRAGRGRHQLRRP